MLLLLVALLPVSAVPTSQVPAGGVLVDPWSAPPLVAALPEPGKETLLEVEALTVGGATTPSIEAQPDAPSSEVSEDAPALEVQQEVAPAPPPPVAPWAPLLGLSVEAGLPDGFAATAMVNPTRWARLQVSGLGNGISSGFRAGVVVMAPWKYVRPLLGLEGGFYLAGSATWIFGPTAPAWAQELLGHVSYLFANGHAGLELGSQAFSLVLRGGVSYLDLELGAPTDSLGSLQAHGTHLSGFIPSARVSLQICFL